MCRRTSPYAKPACDTRFLQRIHYTNCAGLVEGVTGSTSLSEPILAGPTVRATRCLRQLSCGRGLLARTTVDNTHIIEMVGCARPMRWGRCFVIRSHISPQSTRRTRRKTGKKIIWRVFLGILASSCLCALCVLGGRYVIIGKRALPQPPRMGRRRDSFVWVLREAPAFPSNRRRRRVPPEGVVDRPAGPRPVSHRAERVSAFPRSSSAADETPCRPCRRSRVAIRRARGHGHPPRERRSRDGRSQAFGRMSD